MNCSHCSSQTCLDGALVLRRVAPEPHWPPFGSVSQATCGYNIGMCKMSPLPGFGYCLILYTPHYTLPLSLEIKCLESALCMWILARVLPYALSVHSHCLLVIHGSFHRCVLPSFGLSRSALRSKEKPGWYCICQPWVLFNQSYVIRAVALIYIYIFSIFYFGYSSD